MVKPSQAGPERKVSSTAITGRSQPATPDLPPAQPAPPPPVEQKQKKDRKVSRPKVSRQSSVSVPPRSPKKSFTRQESVAVADPEEEEVYAGLDASQSLIIHGKHDNPSTSLLD